MIALRSLLFNVLFIAWSILVQVLGMPSLLLPIAAVARVQQLWVRGSLALLAAVCGVRHEIRGWERLPPEPCVLASKHQSTWDTLIFPGLLPAPGFIIKRELRWIPLFGWYLRRTGCIEIDRKGGATALKRMLAEARHTLAAGRYIVIFPEGTRVVPGQRRPYHPGVAALYTHLQVPVVPVALNSGLFWGRRAFRKRPGVITLEYLDPIPPGLDRKAFMRQLEHRIETATRRLEAETEAKP